MATRSATARLEKRRAELDKLQTTSHAFKEARSVVPRGTGTDKLWFKSGQYWGKAYTIGLILKHEGRIMASLPQGHFSTCFRWIEAGKRPGRMYWVRAGTVFESKALMAFAGVHSLQLQVYFNARQPALAILMQQPAGSADWEPH
ncbi:TPA: hypothetical protein ACH3X2_010461 [Trebouxia sp. C0005]